MAYKAPYTLTKMDVAALRQADYVCVSYDSEESTRVRLIKRVEKTERQPFAQDVEVYLDAPVIVQYCYDRDTSRAQCFGHVSLYQSQHCHASSVINTLRVGDGVVFSFYPDGHTTGSMEDAGLHGDMLKLTVYRNDKVIANWELATCTSKENTARMCKNVFRKTHETESV